MFAAATSGWLPSPSLPGAVERTFFSEHRADAKLVYHNTPSVVFVYSEDDTPDSAEPEARKVLGNVDIKVNAAKRTAMYPR